MMARPNNRAWRVALTTYYLALVVATHWPGANVNVVPGVRLDLFIHIGAYAGLAGLMALAGVGGGWWSGRAVVLIVGLTAALAVLDEATQAIPVVRRTFDVDDLIADLAGAVLGASAGVTVTRRRAKGVQQSSR
jgi:VanZ family protein